MPNKLSSTGENQGEGVAVRVLVEKFLFPSKVVLVTKSINKDRFGIETHS